MNKSINELVKEAFEIAKSKGWHEKSNPIPEVLMKMVCELAEAMEQYRDKNPIVWIQDPVIDSNAKIPIEALCNESFLTHDGTFTYMQKPEGILSELADTVIRIFDTCGENGWDLGAMIRIKMDYNKTRSYKHGGKVC